VSTFGSVSIGSGNGEGELFFSEATADGGYQYILQHVTPAGIASQKWVSLGLGTPTAPPNVAVTSDGTEVTCCWEDYGGINGSVTKGELVRCNTVPSRGTAPDLTLQGGFSDIGSKPSMAQGPSFTAVAYAEAQELYLTEAVLNTGTIQPNSLLCEVPLPEWHVVPKEGSFDVFINDGTTIQHGAWGQRLIADAGLTSTGISTTGSFAVATTSGLDEGDVELLVTHQGSDVMAEIYGLRVPPTATISSPGETPVDPLAAITCDGHDFGVAYGLSGGKLVFRTIDITGAPGAERVIATGFDQDISALSMTLVGGNVLIAAGNSTGIDVFAVTCP
jgi:hypothetical protein